MAAEPTLRDELVQLIRCASTSLPRDVLAALRSARDGEHEGSLARRTLSLMLENAEEARRCDAPVCQDTGALFFDVEHGPDHPPRDVERAIDGAVREAVRCAWLRPGAVDPVDRSAAKGPAGAIDVRLRARTRPGLRVRVLLEGGGAEHVGALYALPDAGIRAGRDLEGVCRCVVDAVRRAQGFGCAPGTIGVGVAGDRAAAAALARDQLLRSLDDESPRPELAALEARLVRTLNALGIGPMGFGGRTTVLGVKIGARPATPSSMLVAVAYMCWAYRRGELVVRGRAARRR